ncbi:MAG: DUF7305 domain-containing protein [Limisphaerales bacterium]
MKTAARTQTDLDIGGRIGIAPTGSLQLYVKNGGIKMGANGIRNDTGFAGNLAIWGMPNVTSVSIAGDGQFVETLYAPNASMSLSGGGSTGTDFRGAVVVKDVKGTGKFTFHFDEALMNTGLRNLQVVSWKEI